MKVAVVRQPREEIVFEERPIPEPGPGQVRIKVAVCGICHSDLHIWEGSFSFARLPIVPGHEIAGTIDALGPDVSGWKVGDRAGLSWTWSTCGRCDACLAGDEPACPGQVATGVHVDGGYAPYVVAPAAFPTPIPDGLDLAEAAPLFCAGLTVYGGLEAAGVAPGMTVAVHGIGGLGHLGVMVASALDCTVVAITRGPDKLELAEELGADETIDAQRVDPGDALKKRGGVDVVLTTVPDGSAISGLLRGLKRRGTLVIVGSAVEPVSFEPRRLIGTGGRILGSAVGTRLQMRQLLDLALRHDIQPMIERYRLEDVPRVFQRMQENRVRFRAVIQF